MRLWQPHPAEPELMDWYRPLLAAARRARAHAVPWQVHADEFDLLGRADRPGHPAVWVYRHRTTRGILCADATGHTYRYVPHRGGPAEGRFAETPVRDAVRAAGLAEAVASEGRAGAPAEGVLAASGGEAASSRPAGWRGKGHLRVVPDHPTVA